MIVTLCEDRLGHRGRERGSIAITFAAQKVLAWLSDHNVDNAVTGWLRACYSRLQQPVTVTI